MVTVSNVSLTFGGQKLFAGADLKFMPGNCYGVIGANGAGKSTFLRILSGELEPTTGNVTYPATQRMSTLKQVSSSTTPTPSWIRSSWATSVCTTS